MPEMGGYWAYMAGIVREEGRVSVVSVVSAEVRFSRFRNNVVARGGVPLGRGWAFLADCPKDMYNNTYRNVSLVDLNRL